MRIWSLHPRHLDRMGLLACWRETLLAQAVLAGRTRGYRNHPQLERFRAQPDPLAAVGAYLGVVAQEAHSRGYRFDAARILSPTPVGELGAAIPVARGQLDYEWQHLGRKLRERSPDDAARWEAAGGPSTHPLFREVPGGVEPWERPAAT
ncbi:pyrimidine dimer DNA glycosylase [Leucobacter sp. UCD-THU]|uniref:pyrimidine dimer DNA glycosylase/endonuclease V n=1 Tax=Leucobacter sp. UCD-THU TaxID=1292023 RepID=UPI00036218B0|nr:pyrimidine dimer DNA glycosylase/endonuclease V [Leucobacter sp. UCD-THU]EYT54884.1 pyrimidine dimer DNA glycosylase [Leucobacter sp. UCD-THU]